MSYSTAATELPPPLYTPKRLCDSSASPKFPSKSSIKSLKVEIHIENEQKSYGPGQDIIGFVSIWQTDKKKKINDFLFNDVEITFQNRLDTKILKGPTATTTSKILFKLDDSPKIDLDQNYSKGFVFKKAVTYPFKFTLPKVFLENACPLNYDIHRNLMPSFGFPSECGLYFNSKDVHYDIDPDMSDRQMLDTLEFKKFMNAYYINVKININLDNAASPISLFQRNKEIKIHNDLNFDDISKSYISLSSRYALQLSEYYNLFETNALNEIKFYCMMDVLKPKPPAKKLKVGSLSLESPLPMLLSENMKISFPLDLTFLPSYKELVLPQIKVHYELNQYLIQSSKCLKPTGFNPSFLEGLVNSKTFRMENDDNEVFIMKAQTIFQKNHLVSNDNWVPVYNQVEAYGNHFQIGLPKTVKNKFVQSTFHHCHIQNVYALKVTVSYQFEEYGVIADVEVPREEGHSTSTLSRLMKKSMKKSKIITPDLHSSSTVTSETVNTMSLYIPITLL